MKLHPKSGAQIQVYNMLCTCTKNVEHYFMALGVAMSKIASDFGIVMKGRIWKSEFTLGYAIWNKTAKGITAHLKSCGNI